MTRILAFSLLLVCSQAALAASPSHRVGFGTFGPLKVGMTEREVARVAHAPVVHTDSGVEEEGCFYGLVRGLPKGIDLMFLDGRLARIDVEHARFRTAAGAGIGTSEAELKRLYGARLKVEPHAYTGPEGHYLTVASPDGRQFTRFETDGRIVTTFYTGRKDAIELIEGCL